jgi:hypothetical protein
MCGQAVVSCDGVGIASSVDFFLEGEVTVRSKCPSSWRILLNSFSSACAQIRANDDVTSNPRYFEQTVFKC